MSGNFPGGAVVKIWAFTAVDLGSIPAVDRGSILGQGTKIPQTMWCGKKKKTKKKKPIIVIGTSTFQSAPSSPSNSNQVLHSRERFLGILQSSENLFMCVHMYRVVPSYTFPQPCLCLLYYLLLTQRLHSFHFYVCPNNQHRVWHKVVSQMSRTSYTHENTNE